MWYSLKVQQEVEGKAVKTAVLILFAFLTGHTLAGCQNSQRHILFDLQIKKTT